VPALRPGLGLWRLRHEPGLREAGGPRAAPESGGLLAGTAPLGTVRSRFSAEPRTQPGACAPRCVVRAAPKPHRSGRSCCYWELLPLSAPIFFFCLPFQVFAIELLEESCLLFSFPSLVFWVVCVLPGFFPLARRAFRCSAAGLCLPRLRSPLRSRMFAQTRAFVFQKLGRDGFL